MRCACVFAVLVSLFFIPGFAPQPAHAQACGNNAAGFKPWLADFKKRAVRSGISQRTVDAALANSSYNRKVISRDRSQKSFKLSLQQFIQRRAPKSTIALGRKHMQSNARLLQQIEKRYGVQGEVLIAIWGLESGFGRFMGNISLFSSLPTLAYDCRRSDFFTNELMAALTIAERRQMSIPEMKGAWAGEIGQTQFLASSYVRYAVDFDGNGRPDLMRSRADVLASTANFLRKHGWRPGKDWSQGTRNFQVLRDWNRASVYQKTIAYMATELRR